jgi:hypothetical protein
MARITCYGPSNADVTKETVTLKMQGKADTTGKPNEWSNWKVSQ